MKYLGLPIKTDVKAGYDCNTGNGFYYTVQPGENLFRIGMRYNIPWTELARINGIPDGNQVQGGQRIYIPR